MKTFSLSFTIEQIQVLDKALQQAPYCVAAPLLQEINRQLEAQQQIPWKEEPPK